MALLNETAFREYLPDQDVVWETVPSDDWAGTSWGSSEHDSNVRHGIGEREPHLSIVQQTSDIGILTWSVESAVVDAEILVKFTVTDGDILTTTDWPVIAIRNSGADTTETGYLFIIETSGNVQIDKVQSGTITNVGSASTTANIFVGQELWVRCYAVDSDLKMKAWNSDEEEPSAWDLETTDTDITTATLPVGIPVTSDGWDAAAIHYISMSTDPAAQPPKTLEQFGRHVSQLVDDPEAELDFGFFAKPVSRSDGVENPFLATVQGLKLDPQDYPSDEVAPPYMIEEPKIPRGIFADIVHDDSVDRIEIDFLNIPSELSVAGPLDSRPVDETFAGREAAILVAEAHATSWRSYSRLLSGVCEGEPVADGDLFKIQISTSSKRLDERLEVKRYVGLPSCLRQMTTSGGAGTAGEFSAPHQTYYDLTSFTLAARFRLESMAVSHLLRKDIGLGDQNWWVRVHAAGHITHRHTHSGGTEFLMSTNSISLQPIVADTWYTLVVGVLADEYAYIMLDGEVLIDSDNPNLPSNTVGTPDTQTAAVIFSRLGDAGFQEGDVRVYGEYLTPDQGRIELSNFDPVSFVPAAHWKCNETSGNTAADSSPNSNDATAVAGVENTDYEWFPTDLGEEEQAGEPMPIAHGTLDHTSAELVDSARERFRVNDRDLDTNFDFEVTGDTFAQGASTTSNNEGDGVASFTGEQDRPVTAEILYGGSNDDNSSPVDLASNILTSRLGFEASEISETARHRMRSLAAWTSGYANTGEPPEGREALSKIIGGIGCNYREDQWSRIEFDRLHPPIPDGPVSNTSLELMGYSDINGTGNVLSFKADNILSAPINTDCSVACWIYPMPRYTQDVVSYTTVPVGPHFIDHEIILGCLYNSLTPFFYTPGVSKSTLEYILGPRELVPWKWNFLIGTLDFTNDRRALYHGVQGDSGLVKTEESTLSGTNSAVGHFRAIIGGGGYPFAGAIQAVSTWSKAQSDSSADTLFSTPASSGDTRLEALINLDEGSGLAEETELGTKSRPRASRWSPILDINLDEETGLDWSFIKTLMPATKIEVGYRPNWHRINFSNLAGSVTENEAIRFTREKIKLPSPIGKTDNYVKGTKDILLDTMFYEKEGASSVGSYALSRFGEEGRRFGELAGSGIDHRFLGMQRGDQLRISHSRHDLSSGRMFRVVKFTSDGVVLWG